MHAFMKPCYQDDSLVNLMSSLAQGLGGRDNGHPPLTALPPQRVRLARRVALLLIDGLGQALLERRGGGILARHHHAVLTSVFPSTTASAVTTLLTGEAPQQHGVTGWFTYLRELGAVWTVLPFKPRALPGEWDLVDLPAGEILGLRPFSSALQARTHIVSPQRIIDSSYSRATSGNATRHAYDTLEEYFDTVAELLTIPDPQPCFIYAYWPDLDAEAHRCGAASVEVAALLERLETAFATFLQRVQGTDALILLTADHGMIDTRPEQRLQLDEHPELAECLALPLCGEPRAVFCYLRPGAEDRFLGYIERHLAHACHCVSAARLIEQGYFGLGAPHPRLHERVGDYVLLMKETYILKDRVIGERPFVPVGIHGGLTPEEMYVPLILVET